jgi:6-pyruvoyltetrahydropterin/6-carboxytetrahydropterin synthase
MYRVTKVLHFCYGHRLLNYEGACAHPHGHNGRVEIELSRENLDARGMVQDFSEIKDGVKKWIDQNLDHRMLLNRADPLIPYLKEHQEPFFPMEENPTAENIAKVIYQYVKSQGYPVTEVRLWETDSSFATYRE